MFVRLNENLSIFLDFFLQLGHCPTDRGYGVSECKQPLFKLIRNHMSLLRCISYLKKAFFFSVFLFFILTPNPTLAGCKDGFIGSHWNNDSKLRVGEEQWVLDGELYVSITLGRCYKFWKGCSIYHCNTTKKQMYDRIVKELKRKANRQPGTTYCLKDRSFMVHSSEFGSKKTEVVSSWGVPECQKF